MPNRLAGELSPYLRQHAENPVDWYPWGEAAFARARAEHKPIFLSIGYSTCHWCHVMAHESFENDAVAAVLNEHFVSIKVDREERPDVDRVYMTFVQTTTGSGGWPMSVWLTPDLKPFHGGTYFPPASKWGRPGFLDLLLEVARVWRADASNVTASAEARTEQLRVVAPAPSSAVPGADALGRAVQQCRDAFDARLGGFGDAPKFPRPSELLFLLREHARTGDIAARDMALGTLRAMALGGLRDHVGGGFHRYSVDAAWRVPHFEKMLYDQAQLVLAYAEAAQVSADPFYADVAEDTLQYVLQQMTDEDGGFYSAEDADSVPPEDAGAVGAHKKEGAYYLWRAGEIDALLGEDAPIVRQRFGIEAHGNAPQDPQQEFVGKNLLYVARPVEGIAADAGRTPAEVEGILGRARRRMFDERFGRPHPSRDDKILTAWNGLMIAAFSRVARMRRGCPINGPETVEPFLEAARRAASFLQRRMWHAESGTLLRRWREGHADIEGFAEDYAYLIAGLLELFQADADPAWLDWAIALQRRQDDLFWDADAGGWFNTTGRDASVLLRLKDDYDGAEPTASSVSVMNLLLLSHLAPDSARGERIDRTLRHFGARLEQMGRSVPMMAAALSTALAGLQQIVIVEGASMSMPPDAGAADALDRAVAARYLPFALTLRVNAARQRALADRLPLLAAMTPVDGAAAVYVCRDFTCRQPVTTVEALDQELKRN